MSGRKISMSLLTLQGLLSGAISHQRFSESHELLVQHLRGLDDQGAMISEIEVKSCPAVDDDEVIITFNGTKPRHLFERKK